MTTPDEVPPDLPPFFSNRPYERRFAGPNRPSNERRMELFDKTVRERITEVTEWLDGQGVVAEAEALLATGGNLRRGDPGE